MNNDKAIEYLKKCIYDLDYELRGNRKIVFCDEREEMKYEALCYAIKTLGDTEWILD